MKPIENSIRLLLSAVLISTVAFTSCKKDATSSAGEKSYMRFKTNGVQKELADCNVVFMGTMPSVTPTVYYCHITSGVTANWAALSLYTINPMAEKLTYTQEVNAVTQTPIAGIATKNNDDGEYISWQGGWPYYEVNISLTEISDKYIKGKFSGKIRKLDGATIQTITDGEFKADIP